jgi:hypothetical protein
MDLVKEGPDQLRAAPMASEQGGRRVQDRTAARLVQALTPGGLDHRRWSAARPAVLVHDGPPLAEDKMLRW